MKKLLFISTLAYYLISTSCTTQRLPTHGWHLVYAEQNIKGYYHVFQSVPTGKYTLEQQADSLLCHVGDTVILHGYKRIKRVER